jgi:hypothetical protein
VAWKINFLNVKRENNIYDLENFLKFVAIKRWGKGKEEK